VDETTHAVSPKVLDRAFTIEVRDVDFSQLGPAAPVAIDREALLDAFTREDGGAGVDFDVVADLAERHPDFTAWLQGLTNTLAASDLDFGYRVYGEIMMFVANAERAPWYDGFGSSVIAAFDEACVAKILPKFSGTRTRLREPLLAVLAWAIDPSSPPSPSTLADQLSPGVELQAVELPRLAAKSRAMLDKLERQGFVSYL
jgi:hypothetical protein